MRTREITRVQSSWPKGTQHPSPPHNTLTHTPLVISARWGGVVAEDRGRRRGKQLPRSLGGLGAIEKKETCRSCDWDLCYGRVNVRKSVARQFISVPPPLNIFSPHPFPSIARSFFFFASSLMRCRQGHRRSETPTTELGRKESLSGLIFSLVSSASSKQNNLFSRHHLVDVRLKSILKKKWRKRNFCATITFPSFIHKKNLISKTSLFILAIHQFHH